MTANASGDDEQKQMVFKKQFASRYGFKSSEWVAIGVVVVLIILTLGDFLFQVIQWHRLRLRRERQSAEGSAVFISARRQMFSRLLYEIDGQRQEEPNFAVLVTVIGILVQVVLSVAVEVLYWLPEDYDCCSALRPDGGPYQTRRVLWFLIHNPNNWILAVVKHMPWAMALFMAAKSFSIIFYLLTACAACAEEKVWRLQFWWPCSLVLGFFWTLAGCSNLYVLDEWFSFRIGTECYCDNRGLPMLWVLNCSLALLLALCSYIESACLVWVIFVKRKVQILHRFESRYKTSPEHSAEKQPDWGKRRGASSGALPLLRVDPNSLSIQLVEQPTFRRLRQLAQEQGAEQAEEVDSPSAEQMRLRLKHAGGVDSVLVFRVLIDVPFVYDIKPWTGYVRPDSELELHVRYKGDRVQRCRLQQVGLAEHLRRHLLRIEAMPVPADWTNLSDPTFVFSRLLVRTAKDPQMRREVNDTMIYFKAPESENVAALWDLGNKKKALD